MSIMQSEYPSQQRLGEAFQADEAAWFAIQTRARSEKKVTGQLETKGVEAFLPVISQVHRWSDRRQLVHLPLFPGYVFVRINPKSNLRMSVLTTMGVYGFVGAGGAGLPIPDKQIDDVRTVVTNPVSFSLYPYLRVGQRVRVKGGCLNGIEGTLISRDSEQRLVVSVELVRRSVAVRIDGYEVEAV
jgi:transcription antitermination factor NusG